ncbi:hypothetical protein KXJ72_02835 [Comamonas aquatica]|nr:hypothetical protein KXJ72_02835 [Comamonas aquatica]
MTIENNAVSRSPVYGADRVTIWLDRPASDAEFEELREHCTCLTVTNDQPKFQANRKCKLELFQPTRKCLRMAKEILRAETNAEPTYVELARDVTLPNRVRTALLTAFLGSVKVPSQRSLFVQCEGTFYCGQRAESGGRDGSVLAVYADKASKINNARPDADAMECFHVELRLSGKDALRKHGIRTLEDLIVFSHKQFWGRSLTFYALPPSKTELGRLLAACCGGRADASDTAYLKRANRWLDKHSIDGQFIMHNALKATPRLERYLAKTDWNGLMKSIKK